MGTIRDSLEMIDKHAEQGLVIGVLNSKIFAHLKRLNKPKFSYAKDRIGFSRSKDITNQVPTEILPRARLTIFKTEGLLKFSDGKTSEVKSYHTTANGKYTVARLSIVEPIKERGVSEGIEEEWGHRGTYPLHFIF